MVEVDHNASFQASVLNQTKLLTIYFHIRCLILKTQFLKSFCFSHYKPLHALIAYKKYLLQYQCVFVERRDCHHN